MIDLHKSFGGRPVLKGVNLRVPRGTTTVILGGTRGEFLASFFANTTPLDVIGSVVKVAIFGGLIGVICAYYGLNVEGGAAGVGRAVNRAVVGCLVAIFLVNLIYTQWFLSAFPQVSVLR